MNITPSVQPQVAPQSGARFASALSCLAFTKTQSNEEVMQAYRRRPSQVLSGLKFTQAGEIAQEIATTRKTKVLVMGYHNGVNDIFIGPVAISKQDQTKRHCRVFEA